jgi:hypothetical protein
MSTKKERNPDRSRFREAVFARLNGKCCVPSCKNKAIDAHHIIERALWNPHTECGGYLPENGAALCEEHHLNAEVGDITPNLLRKYCGMEKTIYPADFVHTSNASYDKWGKPYQRTHPSNVADNKRMKYPHTPFFRNSPGGEVEEKRENGVMVWDTMCNKDLVFTLKMDGSNVTFDCNGIAARNAQSAPHPSFDMVKSMWAQFKNLIPEGYQVFGEWLYAKHSIHYTGDISLRGGYLQLFAIYNHNIHEWMSWDSVVFMSHALGVNTVPTIREMFNSTHTGYPYVETRYAKAKNLECAVEGWAKLVISQGHEGIVVRSAFSFPWNLFDRNVAKYVRANHVTTDQHWSQQKTVRNMVDEKR